VSPALFFIRQQIVLALKPQGLIALSKPQDPFNSSVRRYGKTRSQVFERILQSGIEILEINGRI
jgi:hypothetical protein